MPCTRCISRSPRTSLGPHSPDFTPPNKRTCAVAVTFSTFDPHHPSISWCSAFHPHPKLRICNATVVFLLYLRPSTSQPYSLPSIMLSHPSHPYLPIPNLPPRLLDLSLPLSSLLPILSHPPPLLLPQSPLIPPPFLACLRPYPQRTRYHPPRSRTALFGPFVQVAGIDA